MADTKATIGIELEVAKARREIRQFRNDFKTSFANIAGAIQIAEKAFSALNAVVSKAVSIGSEAVKLANEQERVERKLRSALALRGAEVDKNFKAIQRFNSEMQQSLGFGDEMLLNLQSQMLAMGLNAGQIKDATKATIGLAEATGQNLASASRLVARAFQGDVAALKRYGITASDTADAQKQLNDLFGVAKAQGGSFASQVRILNANVGDLQEKLGQSITQSNGFRGLLDLANKTVLKLQTFFDSQAGSKFADMIAGMIRGIARGVAYMVTGALEGVRLMVKLVAFEINRAISLINMIPGVNVNRFDASNANEALLGARNTTAELAGILGQQPQVTYGPNLPPGYQPPGSGGGGRRGGRRGGMNLGSGGSGVPASFMGLPVADLKAMHEEKTALDNLKDSEDRALHEAAMRRGEEAIRMQTMRANAANEGVVAEIEAGKKREAFFRQHASALMSSGLTSAFAAIGEAAGRGFEGADKLIAQALGGIVKMIGMSLIQLGAAAVAAGTLGSIVPFLAPATGGPLGVGAGLAAMAVGTGLVAAGTAIGSAGSGAGATSGRTGSRATGGRTSTRSGPPLGAGDSRGFDRTRDQTPQVINVNFSRGFVVGDERTVGRELRRVLKTSGQLQPGGAF